MMNETLIYKYPLIKELIETNSCINPIYWNPHANLIEFSRHNTVKPGFFSRHPSNKAVEMMMAYPELISLEDLICSTNPKIGPLLEKVLGSLQDPPCRWNSTLSRSKNPAILSFIEKHPEKIDWSVLSENECEEAVRILEKNQDKIDWLYLSFNSFAIDILKKNKDKIVWPNLCDNSNPKAIEIIEQMLIEDPNKIDFDILSTNPNAIHIISQHLDKVSLYNLLRNPNAIDIFMQHPKMNMGIIYFPNCVPLIEKMLAANIIREEGIRIMIKDITKMPNSIPFIEKMLAANILTEENIIYNTLFLEGKIALYDLDYQAMSKVRTKLLYTELMEKALHPSRVSKWLDYHYENGGNSDDFEL